MKLSCLWIGILALCFASAEAVNYYVSTSGNDGNAGTYAQPFRTPVRGFGMANAGDTVFVMGGTYDNTGHIRLIRSGESGRPIVLRNYPGQKPVIRFSGRTISVNQILLASTVSYTAPIGWIIIEGFEVTNGWAGFNLTNAHDVIIRRNYIHHMYMGGFGGNGLRVTIDANRMDASGRFEECAADPKICNQDHAIYVTGSYFKITNNIITNQLSYGITVAGYPFKSDHHASPEYAGAKYWLVANNTFAFNQNRGGIVVWQPAASDNRFENNIFYENAEKASGTQGIDFYDCGCNQVVKNNLFYATAPGGTGTVSETQITINTCGGKSSYVETGSINANPAFKNPTALDFHLTSGSPAINKGSDLFSQGVTKDFDGASRLQGTGFDLGAYEYGTASAITQPGFALAHRVDAIRVRPSGTGAISIDWNGNSKATVAIYTLSGRQLASFHKIGAQGATWNPGKSSAGVYLVRVNSGNGDRTAKIYCGK